LQAAGAMCVYARSLPYSHPHFLQLSRNFADLPRNGNVIKLKASVLSVTGAVSSRDRKAQTFNDGCGGITQAPGCRITFFRDSLFSFSPVNANVESEKYRVDQLSNA
jgi:hypothetical protein